MRKRPLYLLGTAIIAVTSLALAGCSAGSTSANKPSSNADQPTTASVALFGEPSNLDFTTTAGSAIPQAMMTNVYEGLVKIDQSGEIVPLLAKDWSISADGTVYDFTLQEGVTFSNGEPFTANDVKFSFERVQSDAWVSTLKNKMNVVSSIEVVSDSEVRITLANPSNLWLFNLGTPVGAIFTPTGVADLANNPVGTGPYKLKVWNKGDSIELETRDDYWGERPKVDAVTLKYFADAVASTNALRTGDVDAVYNLQAPELVSVFESDDAYTVATGTSSGEITLSFNNRVAPFDDVRVRQAVLYALDKRAIIDTAWNGFGTEIATFATPTDPYYEDLNDVYPYDPKKAKELLKAAGHETLDITYTVPTRAYATAVSEIVVSQLKDVGINVTIKSSEFPAVWLDEVFKNHDFQMTTVLAVEARDILTIFNNPDYYIGYDNSTIAPIAAAADKADEAGYISGMKEVARTVLDDAASGVLFLFPSIVITKANLAGVPENAIVEALDLSGVHWK